MCQEAQWLALLPNSKRLWLVFDPTVSSVYLRPCEISAGCPASSKVQKHGFEVNWERK